MTATTSTTTYPTPRPAVKGRVLAAAFIAGAAAIGAVTVETQLGSSDATTDPPPSAVSGPAFTDVVRPAGMPDSVWKQVRDLAPTAVSIPTTELVRPAGMPDGVWAEVSRSSGGVDATRPAGVPDGVWAAINE